MAIRKGKTSQKADAKRDGNASPRASAMPAMTAEELQRLVAENAYFRAKERGFTPGYELEDWVQAEAEVRRRLQTSP